MARARRHRGESVLLLATLVSMGAQGGVLAWYQAQWREPPVVIHIELAGEGLGTVLSTPAGVHCGSGPDRCYLEAPRGSSLTLTAIVDPNSTFEGWDGCDIDIAVEVTGIGIGNALECVVPVSLVAGSQQTVTAWFGRVPEEVEVRIEPLVVADATPPKPLPPALEVTLPEPELEAEMLVEPPPPPPEMLQPPPPPPPLLQPPPPPPPPAVAKAPPPPPPPNMRMVELDDDNVVEKAPDDATHLSDKNRAVAEETAAKETNLEQAHKGDAVASEKSDVRSEDIGGEEAKIAQLETTEATDLDAERLETSDHSGEEREAVGAIRGEEGGGGEDGEDGDGKPVTNSGAFAMRDIEGTGSVIDRIGEGGKKGRAGKKGAPGVRTQISFEDYERIVGKDKLDADRALAKRMMSKRQGRWEKELAMIKSALENFTPDVRPGNQTELGTRAEPFAVFIARMHRRIHELWGFGFLEGLDGKSSDHEMNNWDLWTNIEASINPDGTVHKLMIAHTSGVLAFDVAALDTVQSASPYEETPEVLRSVDGRVYLRWGFYRNWRQCGTFNVEPYILSEVPGGGEDRLDDSVLITGGKPGKGDSGGAPTGAGAEGSGASSPSVPSAEHPEAVHAANLWASGFATANVEKLVRVSATPFHSGAAVIAGDLAEVAAVYRALLEEAGSLQDWKLLSLGSYRKKVGEPPADATASDLLMVVRTKGELVTLVLSPQADVSYRVTGLYR